MAAAATWILADTTPHKTCSHGVRQDAGERVSFLILFLFNFGNREKIACNRALTPQGLTLPHPAPSLFSARFFAD